MLQCETCLIISQIKTIMKILKKYKGELTEWIVFTFIFFFLYDIIWAVADFEDFKQSINSYYLCLFVDLVYCGVFSIASLSVTKLLLRQRFIKRAEAERSIFIGSIVVIVAINILIAGVCDLLMNVIESEFIEVGVWGTLFLFGIIASLLTLIHMLLHYSDIIILKNKENVRLQKKYLKLQLEPHFVFNSLSSLAGMIEDDPQRAEEYVVRLSQVYRYMLFNIDQDYITINEALDFARTYVSLLNLKYNDKIILELDEEKVKGEYRILALSIQLLIENAVKHNSPQENRPLHIQICVQENMLVIKNDRIYFHGRNDQIVESYGIGLKNLKQRYELECGKEIGYSVTHDFFEIRMPIIKKKKL